MAYKDKDKQREANRKAQAKFKAKGITKGTAMGITTEGITVPDKLEPVIPKQGSTQGETARHKRSYIVPDGTAPEAKRGKDIKAFTDLPNTETVPPVEQVRYKLPDIKYQHQVHCSTPSHIKPFTKGVSCSCYQMTVMERLFYRPASKLGRGETNFVSLPGRACYGVV